MSAIDQYWMRSSPPALPARLALAKVLTFRTMWATDFAIGYFGLVVSQCNTQIVAKVIPCRGVDDLVQQVGGQLE